MGALFVAILCMVVSKGHFQATSTASRCLKVKCTSGGSLRKCDIPDFPKSGLISKITALDAFIGRSLTPCQEGYHFGTDSNTTWVDKLCGGEFGICWRLSVEMGWTVRRLGTSGSGKRYYTIDLNDDVFLMHVARKLNNKCKKGETYDKDGRRVWVSNGCKARFYMTVEN